MGDAIQKHLNSSEGTFGENEYQRPAPCHKAKLSAFDWISPWTKGVCGAKYGKYKENPFKSNLNK